MYKLIRFIEFIFDFILPKNPEITAIENMSEMEILEVIPAASEIKNPKYKALFQYKNKITRSAVWAIKYSKNKKIINKFSNLLYEFILEDISIEVVFSDFTNPLLLAIPMHKNDIKVRGYNQSELIVSEIFKKDLGKNFNISPHALAKIKSTPHQSSMKNKTNRLKNLKNCFYANEVLVKNRNIILIDDVITTGTTMSEVMGTLKGAGAKKVIGFSLAH